MVLPQRASERAAAAAVSELRPWIERRLSEAQRALAQIAARAGTVPYLGASLTLVPQAGRTRVHRRGDELLVPAGDARPALERFYKAYYFRPRPIARIVGEMLRDWDVMKRRLREGAEFLKFLRLRSAGA